MSRQYRISVYGRQPDNINPTLLTQVVILCGGHLQQQHHRRKTRIAGHNRKMSKDPSTSSPPAPCDGTPSPSEQHTPVPPGTPENDEAPSSVGEGLS
jgi:hypothetical protein